MQDAEATVQPATDTTRADPSSLSDALQRIAGRLDSPAYRERCAEWDRQGAERVAALDAAERAAAAAMLWRRRGRRYERCTLDNFEATKQAQREVLDRLRQYAGGLAEQLKRGVNVVLIGPAGTGKDHLLAGLVHTALRAGVSVAWEAGSDLWISLRQAIHSQTEAQAVAQLVRPQVLVLSDPVPPHVEATNYERSILYAVVDRRYSDMRPIWVSINAANRADAERRLGTAVVDRLRDGAFSLACDWPSYRGPKI